MKHLKNRKATGIDDILYEMHKYGADSMRDLLVIKAIWNSERVPEGWNESRVILFHRVGHKSVKYQRNSRPMFL